MKERKRRICNFSFYDQEAIQAELEAQARQGWRLEKTGSFFWTYRRAEPKELRFAVTWFPGASEFDPGPTEGELTRLDYCRQDGWELVSRWGVMQILCSEDPGAVPIETEPLPQVENLRRAMRKNVLLPRLVMAALLAWNVFLRLSQFRRDPIGSLADPAELYLLLMLSLAMLACLWEVLFYFRWSRRARRAAENDGVFLGIKGKPAVSWILLGLSTALLLLYVGSAASLGPWWLLWLCVLPLIFLAGNLVKGTLKKRGAPRRLNLALSTTSVALLTVLLLGLLTAAMIRGGAGPARGTNAVGSYDLYGHTREIYDDPLPLTIEELADVEAPWSKEAEHHETVFLSTAEYRQYAVPTEERRELAEDSLEYSVTEVKWDALVEPLRRAVLHARQDEDYDGFIFTDHYEPVDPGPWRADAAYQLHWSESVMNHYLLFQGRRIVEIQFFWEPTAEQIAAAAEKLW